MKNLPENLEAEIKDGESTSKLMFDSHSNLLNFIALLNTGGLAILLTCANKCLHTEKTHILVLFLISIYLILLVKLVYFAQISRISIKQKRNVTQFKKNEIDLDSFEKNKESYPEMKLELTLNVMGVLSLFLFFTAVIMTLLPYINVGSYESSFRVILSYIIGVVLSIFPAWIIYDLFYKWKNIRSN